jgi:hypothetical protein
MNEQSSSRAGMVEPWIIDASMLSDKDDLRNVRILGPASIREFVNAPHHIARLIIAGEKGSGKTLALRKRSFKYRQKDQGIQCVPELQLVEKLTALLTSSLGQDALTVYRTEQAWFVIWSIAICVAIMKRIHHDVPEPLLALMGSAEGGIGEIVGRLVDGDEGRLRKGHMVVNDIVRPFIRECREPIAVFLDSIEEAMEAHAGDQLRMYETTRDARRGHLHNDVWLNCQIALIDVAVEFRMLNAHVKVFAAVRLEAFDRYPTSKKANIEQYVERVTYDKNHLRDIFEENIRLTRDKQLATGEELLANRNAPTPIQQFFGTDTDDMRHVIVGKTENIFDTVWRHTFGRPRDIIVIGHEILWKLAPNDRKDERKLAECIHRRAAETFKNYKKEVIPYWDDRIDGVFPLIKHNVLSRTQVEQIGADYQKVYGDNIDPMLYLFSKGLLGYQQLDYIDNRVMQVFLDTSDNQSDVVAVPAAPHYFIHPCLATEIRHHRQHIEPMRQYSNTKLIVGNGFTVDPDFVLERIYLSVSRTTRDPVVIIDGLRIDELTRFSALTTILFFGLMMAFFSIKREIVSADTVLDCIDELLKRGLIRERLGNRKLGPRAYFADQFEVSDKKKNDVLTHLRQTLVRYNVGGGEPVLSQFGATFELGTFTPAEIMIDLD